MDNTPARPMDDWVLVVDDDPVAREIVRGHLAPMGVEVRDATSAAEALELLGAGALPGVIITDLMMPTMDGFAFCAVLREDPRLRHLPVLCVSAAGDRENRLRALDSGADELLAKPVDDVELLARVRSMDRLRRLRVDDAWSRQIDAVVDAVGEGLAVIDRSGGLIRCNDSARRLLAIPSDASAGFDLSGHLEETLATAADGASPGTPGLAIHAVAGEDRHVHLAGVPVSVAGAPPAIVLAVRDATPQVRAQDLSDLVMSSVGHKLRTPLTGIVSTLELIDSRELPADVAPLVNVTWRAARRLGDSLLRVLDAAAAIQAGSSGRSVTLDPSTTAADLEHELGVDLTSLTVELDLERRLTVDADALAAAIAEYADNARLRYRDTATLRIAAVGDRLDLEVADDGAGFPAALEAEVFTPFLQSDLTGQEAGMGLGLPLVRALVEGAGGSVAARSRPGEPTRFVASLPTLEVSA